MNARLIAATVFGLTCTANLDAQSQAKMKQAPGAVEILKVKDGEYRFRIKSPEGIVIAVSPDHMAWENIGDVQNVLREISTLLNAAAPSEDPESKEKFKDKESAYSFRIKNSKGVVIASPPWDLQWQTRAEVLSMFSRLRMVLQSTAPVEVSLHQPLIAREVNGVLDGLPPGVRMNGGKR